MLLLYDTDYQDWLEKTASCLKDRNFESLDLNHLIEEIEGLGKSDRRAISSYLIRLIEHLLKLQYWQSEREHSYRVWILEINNFRLEIDLILKDSPSLNNFLKENFIMCCEKARRNLTKAAPELANLLPRQPEFDLDQALNEDWLPWQPGQIDT
ncbi:MAG: DUF29 domain-containing protein, partial [Thermostichus sp. DRC_bins_24]